MWGAFGGTRVLEIVRRNNSAGLLWKKIKLRPHVKTMPRSASAVFGRMKRSCGHALHHQRQHLEVAVQQPGVHIKPIDQNLRKNSLAWLTLCVQNSLTTTTKPYPTRWGRLHGSYDAFVDPCS